MKSKLFIIFLFVLNTAFSQKNFVDGYIILKGSSDTLKGKIDDRNWNFNPNTISFFTPDLKEKVYNIMELKAFGIYDKEYYEVKTVDLDVTPFQLESLSTNPQILVKKDTTIALMVLLKADHQLSYFVERLGKTHFFYQNKYKVSELINHKFLQGTYVIHNKIYLKQLDTLLSSCTKKLKINSVNYITNNLIDIFTQFNDCMGCTSTCYVKKETDKNNVSLSLIAGVDLYLITQDLMEKDNKVFQDKSMKTDITFGLGVTVASKRSKGSNHIYTELLFKKSLVENKYYSVGFLEFTLSGILRKQFITYPNFKLFGGVGLGLKFVKSTEVEFTSLTAPNGNWSVIQYKKLPFDGLVEIGFEINRFQVFNRIRYNPFNSSERHTLLLHDNTVTKGSFINQFCVSYQFLRKKKDI